MEEHCPDGISGELAKEDIEFGVKEPAEDGRADAHTAGGREMGLRMNENESFGSAGYGGV